MQEIEEILRSIDLSLKRIVQIQEIVNKSILDSKEELDKLKESNEIKEYYIKQENQKNMELIQQLAEYKLIQGNDNVK